MQALSALGTEDAMRKMVNSVGSAASASEPALLCKERYFTYVEICWRS